MVFWLSIFSSNLSFSAYINIFIVAPSDFLTPKAHREGSSETSGYGLGK